MSSLLAFVLVLAPQGEVRTAGRVLDLDGAAVANAEVTFLTRPIPRSIDAGPEHRVVVRTDKAGLFRAGLRHGARYSVWAGWDDAASDLAESVVGGEFVELRAAPDTGAATLTLGGTEAWPENATFTLRAIIGGENIDFAPLTGGGDRWRLPPLPPRAHRAVEVLDARGEVLWADGINVVGGAARLDLPAPAEFAVEVTDEDGKPVEGVLVLWHIRNYWYSESGALRYGDRFRSLWPSRGETDAEGRLTVRVPDGQSRRELWLMSVKDGYRMSLDGIDDGKRFQNGKGDNDDETPAEAPIAVTLRRSDPDRIDLALDRTTPFAEPWLYLVGRVHVSRGNGATGTPINLTVPVKAGIAELLSPLPPSGEIEIAEIVLAGAAAARLREAHGFAPRSVWRLPHPDKLIGAGARRQIDLAEQCMLQVSAPDGRPAAHAVVLAGAGCGSGDKVLLRTDRLGRVLVPRGEVAVLGAKGAPGIGVRAAPLAGEAKMTMSLQELGELRLRVVDDEGKPVANQSVRVQQVSGADGDFRELLATYNELMSLRGGDRTDADGNIVLSVPPFECSVVVAANRRQIVEGRDLAWDPAETEPRTIVVSHLK